MALVTPRRLRYMGKESLWKGRFGAWFLTALGGFPVKRGTADREALRACQEVLERGEPLVLFPEGTRQFGPETQHFFDGAAFLACRTGAPIVPVGLGGTEAAMPKGSKMVHPVKMTIVIGEPLVPATRSRPTAGRRATTSRPSPPSWPSGSRCCSTRPRSWPGGPTRTSVRAPVTVAQPAGADPS